MPARARVLVVEDDDVLRLTLADILTDEGFDLRSSSNGREALDILATWEPRLIILDLMMPEIDAFEFRRRQRLMGLAADAKVLVVSAARGIDSAAEQIGADAWLGKPFALTAILDVVERLIIDDAA